MSSNSTFHHCTAPEICYLGTGREKKDEGDESRKKCTNNNFYFIRFDFITYFIAVYLRYYIVCPSHRMLPRPSSSRCLISLGRVPFPRSLVRQGNSSNFSSFLSARRMLLDRFGLYYNHFVLFLSFSSRFGDIKLLTGNGYGFCLQCVHFPIHVEWIR